ncbi:MAG: isoleucine--tRNA ligase [Arenicellales bacterium]
MTTKKSFKKVEGRYNGPGLETDMLAFWAAQSIFEKSIEQSKGKPRFSFNEGPPTANGKPGIHHVLARAYKDIFPRYKTMQGFYAPRKAGWDTHGLPVEHEIEKELGIFDKKEIEKQIGVAEFTQRCRDSVMRYIGEWEKMTERMGFWVNLDEAYYTLDNNYIESVWALLKRIWEKDLIYSGYKVVPYDPRIGATLSSHEVAQGYQEVEDPSITVRFTLAGEENTSFLVWTTTPWTLPSNLLLAVGEDIDYAYVEHEGETFIVAEALLGKVFGEDVPAVIKTVKGADLKGRQYERLLDYLPVDDTNCFKVVCADFVSVEDGTGIVHIAPAYGVDDLALGKTEGLPILHGVNLDGYMKPEITPAAGAFFKDADPLLIEEYKKRGILFKEETVLHNYPFGWRTGDPLIYYAKQAWYIKTTDVKDRMVELNQQIKWVPERIKDGRFGKWLEGNVDWALSRERFWGTPLPVWTSTEGDHICIGSVAELETLTGRELSELDLHRPAVDEITFEKDGKTYTRVPEVIDCWFDSGAMPYAQWHYPFENKDIFEQHAPADYICEAIDQTRGWFYTLHAIAALVDDDLAYKNCICLSHIVDDNGKKMSKSQGNIINPYDVFDTVGADALRWYFLARISPEAQKRMSVDIIREVAASFINTLWNTYSFFVMYAELDEVDLNRDVAYQDRPLIDRWILALAHQTIGKVTDGLDNYTSKPAGEAIETLVDQLSNWYVRRNRRRYWKGESGDDKQAAYLTLYEVLEIVTRLTAPFMPFLSEHLYQNLVRMPFPERPESVHMETWPTVNTALLNDELVTQMDVVQRVVGLGRATREKSQVRIRQPLSRILVRVPNEQAKQALNVHLNQVLEELNIKEVEFIAQDADIVSYDIKPKLPEMGKRHGRLVPAMKQVLSEANGAEIAGKVANGESFELEVSGEMITFGPEDVIIQTASAEGYASAEEGEFLVALETNITPELALEGLARELVRSVQDARKQADLQISDRIALHIEGSDLVTKALETYRDTLASETLAEQWLSAGDVSCFKAEGAVDGEHWQISLKRI